MENDLEIHQYPYEFTVYPSYEIYKDTVAILGEILFGNIIDDSFHETELELNFTTVEHGCDSTIFYHVTV